MKDPTEQIRAQYLSTVISFLSDRNELGLHQSYELGRRALDSKLGILEVAEAYVLALSEILKQVSPESSKIVIATQELLSTSLAPYEMTHRGFQDSISRLNKMNLDLEQQALELKATNQELEAFSYTVSHDIRSPVSGIGSLAEIMLDEYGNQLDEKGREYLVDMITSVKNTLELVEGLLALSKFSRQEVIRVRVDLSQMAQAIVRDLRKAKENETAQPVAVSITENLIVQGDEKLLYAVLSNLLGNAWKYSSKKSHPQIEFGFLLKDDKPTYFVKDNGAGFDMQLADKLFSPFQRFHSANQFPGTGVGLATVRRIWAEAKLGQGATFYFTL